MFERIYRLTEAVLAIIAGTGLLAMMLLTFVDVIGRYGFHKSIFGTAEYVEMLMVVTVFAGVAFVSAGNRHITVSIFDDWLNRSFPNLQRWVVLVFTLFVYALLAYELCAYGLGFLKRGKLTPVLSLPQWYLPMTAGVLSALGVVLFASAIIHTRGHPDRLDTGAVASESDEDTQGFE